MAGFLYHIPGVKVKVKAEQVLKEFGLLDDILDSRRGFGTADSGPAEKPGCYFYRGPESREGKHPRAGYFPNDQVWLEWEKIVISDVEYTYWIGYEKARPPQPVDLVRKSTLRSYPVTLADGEVWEIPVARFMAQGTVLPRSVVMSPDGEFTLKVAAKYFDFWERSSRHLEAWMENDNPQLNEDDPVFNMRSLHELAIIALSKNYRIGAGETSALELFTDDSLFEISSAVVGLDLAHEILTAKSEADKKKVTTSATITPSTEDG